MLVHRRVTPSIKFAGTHLYTWVERGTVRVKCLAQEHNTMSPARARTRSERARSGVERTNHEATAPLRICETASEFKNRNCKKLAVVVQVLSNMQNVAISRCCFCEERQRNEQKIITHAYCTAIVFVAVAVEVQLLI